MRWRKLGHVFVAKSEYDWMKSHAFIPTAELRDHNIIRIYAAFLDDNKIGRIGYIEVVTKKPTEIINISNKPVLDIGQDGTFDDNGVTPISIVDHNDKKLLYYVGWQLGVKVRYYLFAGLAISTDKGETFRRYSKVPILDRCDDELFLRTAPGVIKDGDIWKMWYVAGSEWIELKGKLVPKYNMRYVTSEDGLIWSEKSKVCMELKDDEYGFGRPVVLKEDGIYKMFYSIRNINKGYRIGYAESNDGLSWVRKDNEVGIDVSETGWDSEMICFPSIVDVNGKRYMFYNGNNYGETGFGVALLEE